MCHSRADPTAVYGDRTGSPTRTPAPYQRVDLPGPTKREKVKCRPEAVVATADHVARSRPVTVPQYEHRGKRELSHRWGHHPIPGLPASSGWRCALTVLKRTGPPGCSVRQGFVTRLASAVGLLGDRVRTAVALIRGVLVAELAHRSSRAVLQ
jgi:hypothetical protein